MEPNEFLDNFIIALLSIAYIIGIFFILSGIVMLAYEVYDYYNISKVSTWPVFKKGAVITISTVETAGYGYHLNLPFLSDVSAYDLYRTRVAFDYTVNGVKYRSSKLSYYEPWSTDIIFVTIEDEYYQPGTIVDVIVNPDDPSEAYLINKSYGGYVYLLLAIVLLVVGALLYERATRT
jgi:hypothetical protein